jgi:hypothetical protein
MAERCEVKWCASRYTNAITLKKLTREALRFPRGTYHDTWAEAHDALVARNQKAFEIARRELASATRALVKAKVMKPPAPKEMKP